MQSKMSLFNRDLFLQIARNVGWISIVYFLGLLFALPIRMMLMYSETIYDDNWHPPANLFQYDYAIQFILLIAAPVLLSVFLFRFLQVRQWSDMMHSLPVSRDKIFHFYSVAGMVFLLLPILAISIILMILQVVYGWDYYYGFEDIFQWAAVTAVFNLVMYFAGVFVAMVTGISVVQAVLTYILLLFPAGISLLLTYNLGMLLYGFPSDYFQVGRIELISPITHLTILEGTDGRIGWQSLLLYMVITVVLYILALLIYKRRNAEAASEPLAFGSLKAIFKFGVTVCMMMLGGLYFGEYQRTFNWLLFGYAFGTVFGYFVAEMVLQKTWRVFGLANFRGFAVYSGIIVALLIGIQSFGGYEKYVPAQEKIKKVTLSNQIISRNEEDTIYMPSPLKSIESIDSVRKLHSEIIANEKMNKHDLRNTGYFYFIYELKSGKKVIREYRINEREYEKWLRPLQMSTEYIRATNPLFKIKEESIRKINIRDEAGLEKIVSISDVEEIHEAVSILKKELENETYEEWRAPVGTYTTIEITDNSDTVHMQLKTSYREFQGWLKEKGLYDEAVITPKDVKYILVSKKLAETTDFRERSDDPIGSLINEMENDPDTLKIKDKEKIQEALDQAGYSWYEKKDYLAIFVYNRRDMKEIRSFNEKDAPAFIKSHFAK
ncbi:DUF6449 domain-containing protein [Bacillus sp. B-jedd]|uniref:DUF6449 domain-containing protein n=1 Tax=Bacillus sp. B-jedd TaxID=1476857 RepID=UPI00051567A7|nr:DUF6449 domain-containing protein [Bacillus sp. B-jedd]CEG27043.1 hypothetical protein BN1002_01899 [Bacillus sp. B-jedd]